MSNPVTVPYWSSYKASPFFLIILIPLQGHDHEKCGAVPLLRARIETTVLILRKNQYQAFPSKGTRTFWYKRENKELTFVHLNAVKAKLQESSTLDEYPLSNSICSTNFRIPFRVSSVFLHRRSRDTRYIAESHVHRARSVRFTRKACATAFRHVARAARRG